MFQHTPAYGIFEAFKNSSSASKDPRVDACTNTPEKSSQFNSIKLNSFNSIQIIRFDLIRFDSIQLNKPGNVQQLPNLAGVRRLHDPLQNKVF